MARQKIEENRLRELVALGISDRGIARNLGVSRTAIWHARIQYRLPSNFGEPHRPRSITVAEYNKLAHLVALGLSDAEMAPLIGISPLGVRERRRICHIRSQWVPPKKIRSIVPPPPTADERFAMLLAGRRFSRLRVTAAPRFKKLPPPQQIETGTSLSRGAAAE